MYHRYIRANSIVWYIMHTRYDNVLGTSQAHPGEHAPMRMGLDESTLPSQFGERLKINWSHLELWSDEPTLSSLLDQDNNHYTRRLGEYWISGHPPLVSWIAFAIQEWGSWFYILEAMIDRASGGKLTEHAMSFRILANCCLWKVASCASPVDIPLQVVNWIFVRVMCAWGCNSSIHQLTNASDHFDKGITQRLLRYHRYIRKDAIVWFTS